VFVDILLIKQRHELVDEMRISAFERNLQRNDRV
jgi:hypothetical protein